MLASILPGLREARVPLAAGVLWLLAICAATSWLAPFMAPTLLLVQVQDLAGAFGVATLLAAMAFGSYLVGVLVLSLPVFRQKRGSLKLDSTSAAGLDERIRREIRSARARRVPYYRLASQFDELEALEEARYPGEDDRETNAEEMASENPGSPMSLSDIAEHDQWTWLEKPEAIAMIGERVVADLELAELSLQATTRDVYDKYDRMRAEGEFRQAVAPPLVAAVVAVAIRLSFEYGNAWFLVALALAVPLAFLWFSGRAHLVAAQNLMIQAVLGGQAISPTLKLITDLQPPPPAV